MFVVMLNNILIIYLFNHLSFAVLYLFIEKGPISIGYYKHLQALQRHKWGSVDLQDGRNTSKHLSEGSLSNSSLKLTIKLIK